MVVNVSEDCDLRIASDTNKRSLVCTVRDISEAIRSNCYSIKCFQLDLFSFILTKVHYLLEKEIDAKHVLNRKDETGDELACMG